MNPETGAADTAVTRALQAAGVPFQVFQHAGPVTSLEQAAQERGQTPEQVVRSLLFRVAEGQFVMVAVAGPAQVSWATLRRYLGVNRVTTASADEVLRVTGYRPGAVSPLGLPGPVRTLIDRSVFAVDEISIGSGERGIAVLLRSADLARLLPDAEAVEVLDMGYT